MDSDGYSNLFERALGLIHWDPMTDNTSSDYQTTKDQKGFPTD